MSFPRYPAYKDSGVEWLGEVPGHWDVSKLKHACRLLSGGTPNKANLDYWDGSIPWASSKDLKTEILADTIDHVTDLAVEDGAALAEPGDLLVVVRGMILAHSFPVAKVATKMAFNQDLKAVRVVEGWDADYFAAALRAAKAETFRRLDEAGHGTKALRMEAWTGMALAKPPSHEQRAIAAFLARESARIDALVAEQERLIELLRENRQAVISHAVTKGLDPNVPMKDSGIEWLGEVPAHWRVMPLKRDLDFLTSGSRGWAENYADEGDLFIRIMNLTRDNVRLDLSDVQRVVVPEGSEGSRTRVRAGDVLFSITAFLGSVAVVPDDLECAYVSQHVALARLRQAHLTPNWVAYAALSVVGKTWFDTQSYGGTKIQLSLDDVRDLPLPVPPIAEQREISGYIEHRVGGFDTLITSATRAITLLQERRAALITAAVTGQIDLRGVA